MASTRRSRAPSTDRTVFTGLQRIRGRVDDEVGGAALLLLATVAALAWANAPFGATYDEFWHSEFAVRVGSLEFSLDLQHWVNDGLMAFFFFVVGLEVKRELVIGQLANRRMAAVPAVAALAGIAVPALFYVAFNLNTESASAWGVVISTDTAFLLGIAALLGRSCPPQLRVFLLALAIADDVGALAVIAIFYTEDLQIGPLLLAVAGLGLMFGLRWLRVWRGPAYFVLAVAAWVALYTSGVHATLLGVAMALITPAYRPQRREVEHAERDFRAYLQSPNPDFAHAARLSIDRSVPVGERLQRLWRPWTTFVIIPLFALANAGVALTGETLSAALTSPVTLGIIAGLVLGKLVGILLGTVLAVRIGLGDLAPGLNKTHLAGGAALSGMGFTISLFIVDLAFADDALADQARVGVLAASVLAAVLGSVLLRIASRRDRGGRSRPVDLEPPVDPTRDHIRGPVDAPLTLVGFGDFDAPFAGIGAVDELRERLGDRLRYVFRYVPLDAHPHARLAAEAAEAAGAQGRFWEMHDRLFAAPEALRTADLLDHADALGLDVQRFARDLGSGQYTARIEEDLDSARISGVDSSHTFFVNGRRHEGSHDAATLEEALLAGLGGSARASSQAVERPPAPDAAPTEVDVRSLLADLPEDLEETPDRGGDHPRLTDDQLARIARHGVRRRVERGDILYRPGDVEYPFFAIAAGSIAVIGNLGAPRPPVIRVHGDRRFLGELDIFSETPVVRAAVVVRAGEVVRLSVPRLRALLEEDAELREVISRAYLVRRAIRLELFTDLRILGRSGDADTERLERWAHDHHLAAEVVDVTPESGAALDLELSDHDLPVVVTRAGDVLCRPDDAALADLLDPEERSNG